MIGCKAAIPHLIRTRGRIINIGSIVGLHGQKHHSEHAAAKAGLVACLCSEEKGYISGHGLVVDGGRPVGLGGGCMRLEDFVGCARSRAGSKPILPPFALGAPGYDISTEPEDRALTVGTPWRDNGLPWLNSETGFHPAEEGAGHARAEARGAQGDVVCGVGQVGDRSEQVQPVTQRIAG